VEAAFGSKRGLLAALVDPVASGRRFQELLGDLRAATDPRRRVELAARLTRQVYEVWAPEFDLLRGAGAVAPELAEVARQVGARRRQNQTRLIAYLSDQGVLRGGLAPQEATDVLWTLTGYDLYRALVVECGWAPARYEAWLAAILIQHLIAPG
jgi:AcrR family transcriptional regulator